MTAPDYGAEEREAIRAEGGDYAAQVRERVRAEQGAEWGEPELFTTPEPAPIPADILPGYLGEYADALSRSTQTPPAFSVAAILSVLSVALQRKFRVYPYADDAGYSEPGSLWTLNLSPPGTRKSPILAACVKPLAVWERAKYTEMADDIKINRHTREILNKRIDELKKAMARPATDEATRESHMAAIEEIEKKMPPELIAPRLLLDDVTIENLQTMMALHGGKAAIISDEGGAFATLTGIYTSGNFNVNALLQGHSGGTVRVDRQTRSVLIEDAALAMGLSVQPSIITEMPEMTRRKLHGNGLMARFLYFCPKSTLGFRDVYRHDPVPQAITERYHEEITKLLNIPVSVNEFGEEVPQKLTLSDEARALWLAFSAQIETRMRPEGDLRGMSDWGGKIAGQMLRVAGLFRLSVDPERTTIDTDSMGRAVDLGDLLITHAMPVYDIIRGGGDSDAMELLRWVGEMGQLQFTERDGERRFRAWKQEGRMETALAELERRSIISEAIKLFTRGRPSTIRKVNPVVVNGGV
jgi:putative DNA primase/helicase